MAKFLRIALWKANGLYPHIKEVKLFVNQNYIDVLLISESHFTDGTHCSIPQYNIYHTNHPDATAHAVTAVIIRQTISHYELPSFQQDYSSSGKISYSSSKISSRSGRL